MDRTALAIRLSMQSNLVITFKGGGGGKEIHHCLHDQHIQLVTCNAKFLTSDMHSARGNALLTPQVYFISKVKLTPGWVLISVNFNPIQEIGPKVGSGRSL